MPRRRRGSEQVPLHLRYRHGGCRLLQKSAYCLENLVGSERRLGVGKRGSALRLLRFPGVGQSGMTTSTSQPNPVRASPVEMFAATNPDLEVWWDASPLVFESWRAHVLRGSSPEHRDELAEQLRRLWDPGHPEAALLRGVTSNPLLSLAAIRDDPDRWVGWLRSYRETAPAASEEQIYWALYKEIVRLGAAAFRPLYDLSGCLYGHISALVDPRSSFDRDAMLSQALELATLGENVMVEVPISRDGLAVLRELTRRGIPTNSGLAYTVSQLVAAAEAVQAGLREARVAGVDLTGWRSVVGYLGVRWENESSFAQQGIEAGVPLSPEDRRWASIAVFKEACGIFRHRAYPSKMLLRSAHLGPAADGAGRCWPLQQMAGVGAVFTMHPEFLTHFLRDCCGATFTSQIWESIPEEVMSRLRRVPYFMTGYSEVMTRLRRGPYFMSGYSADGLPIEAFDEMPALVSTLREFAKATEAIIGFVHGRLARD